MLRSVVPCVILSALAGSAPAAQAENKALEELLARIPADSSAVVILPGGAKSAEALAKADKRLGGNTPALWPALTGDLPDAKAIDGDAPAALVVRDAPEGFAWRVRLLRVRAGADPLAGAERKPADAWQVVTLAGNRTVYTSVEAGWLVVAAGKADAEWFRGAKARLMPGLPREQLEAGAKADLIVRLAPPPAHPDDGVADAARFLDVLPHADTARRAAEMIEQAAGPMRSFAGYVTFGEAGVRTTAFADFAADSRAGRWLAAQEPPRGDPFAGLAVGEPAMMAALQFSPKASQVGLEDAVGRAVELLRKEAPALPAEFGERYLAAAKQAAGATRGVAVSVGLPGAGAPGILGLQGAVDTVPGSDYRKVVADLAAVLNDALAAAGKRVALPMEVRRQADARKLGDKPVDAIEIAPVGDGLAANAVRGLLQSVLGPEGFKLLVVSAGPERTIFGMAGNPGLLEKTVAGQGGLPANHPAMQRLAVLPKERHGTLLISPGRLLLLGRRIQQNALRLPEWKPTGFIAAGIRFSETGARLDVDVPWAEAEALTQWAAARNAAK